MIRKATKADIAEIQRIANIAFPATYSSLISAQQIDYMLDWMYSTESLTKQMDEGCEYFLYDDKGYISLEKCDEHLYQLHKIYVLPSAQGQGIGRAFFDFVKQYVTRPCVVELTVNRSNKAKHFYEHMGMYVHHEVDAPIGNGYYMNDYIMHLDLE